MCYFIFQTHYVFSPAILHKQEALNNGLNTLLAQLDSQDNAGHLTLQQVLH